MTAITNPPIGRGRSIFNEGFRPSFLTGAIWVGLASLIMLPSLLGDLQAHEMLYGYLSAIIAGFILTAIPGWTGRPPLRTPVLAVLILTWLAGRVAIAMAGIVGPAIAGGIDSLFLLLVALVALRETVAAFAWTALPPIGLLILFYAGNDIFHLGSPELGKRIGVAAVVMLVTLVGGSVLPKTAPGSAADDRPSGFGSLDLAVLAVSAVALAAWIGLPGYRIAAGLLVVAGILQAIRLSRWVAGGTGQTTLTLVQHIAYGLLPLGFLIIGFSGLTAPDAAAASDIRAWTVSATGILALGILARVSPGGTAPPASARLFAGVIYAAFALSILIRLFGGWSTYLPPIGGAALIVVFGVFTLGALPLLARSGR
jgi:uncharacterized protein involved in response to NO